MCSAILVLEWVSTIWRSIVCLSGLCVVTVASGCAVDDRSVAALPLEQGQQGEPPRCAEGMCNAGPPVGNRAISALGEACTDDAECTSNVCASDVDELLRCCDRDCGEAACERCSPEGVCGAPPAFAAECAEVTCAADDVCRDFQQAVPAGRCTEASCATEAECSFNWTPAAREGAACVCGATGCTLAVQERCTRGEDCASGACHATLASPSICCAEPCGTGEVCKADGSGCEVEPVCTDDQLRCNGATYQRCAGGQWLIERECGALGCDRALNGCRGSAGEACTTTADCGEGSCRETLTRARVCCTAACDTACRRCADTGTACQAVPDDDACGAITCPADSTCRDYPASITQNRCVAGACGSPADLCTFTPRNAGQACSSASLCDTAGNCNASKRDNGAACTADNQCGSNQCVSGVCCESACDGPGQTCDTGECACSGGLELCDDACVDLATTRSDCGACGDVCLGGQCLSGVCRLAEIAAGGTHTCIMLPNLGVRCWGSSTRGRLGYGNGSETNIGDNEMPASVGTVSTGGTVIQLAAGGAHTCALLSAGDVRCWGDGSSGQLGYGNTNVIGDNELPSSAGTVSVGGSVVQVVAGAEHTCGLLSTGVVRCWGGNSAGQLGYGNANNIGDNDLPSSLAPVNIGDTVVQLAAGGGHTCALLDTGAVRCWGNNDYGQLGYGHENTIGDNEPPASAGNVNVGGAALSITAGLFHTCALLSGGNVRCWGRANSGQIGYGASNDIGDNETPASAGNVNIGAAAASIQAGGESSCAVLTTGNVRCWGSNFAGQLGYGNTDDIGDDEPLVSSANVSIGGTVAQIAVGTSHACAVLDPGTVRCWGAGASGRLGYGNTNNIGDDELPSSAGNVVVR